MIDKDGYDDSDCEKVNYFTYSNATLSVKTKTKEMLIIVKISSF